MNAEYRIYGVRQTEYGGWQVFYTNLNGTNEGSLMCYQTQEVAESDAEMHNRKEPERYAREKAWEEDRKRREIHYDTSVMSWYKDGVYAGD